MMIIEIHFVTLAPANALHPATDLLAVPPPSLAPAVQPRTPAPAIIGGEGVAVQLHAGGQIHLPHGVLHGGDQGAGLRDTETHVRQ